MGGEGIGSRRSDEGKFREVRGGKVGKLRKIN